MANPVAVSLSLRCHGIGDRLSVNGMWYLTNSDTELPLRPTGAKAELDEQAPMAGEQENADNSLVPGSEYWLP